MGEFRFDGEFIKFDETLGLVMGWAIICKEGGVDYFDLQDDHIPEDSMLKASTDFMLHSRVGKEMHDGGGVASVVFAWPMTGDVAKAFGIQIEKTGLMIAFKPDSEEMVEKFRNGDFTGFSIGGERGEDEEVD